MPDVRNEIIDNLQVRSTISGGGIQALARTPVVSMTSATSGSNGIQVLDDDDIDFGTGNFTIHWEGSLPDWTPASETRLFRKNTDSTTTGVVLNILTTGAAALYLINGGVSSTAYSSVTPVGGVDNALQQITAVCVRESASAAGSVTIYANGQPVGAPATITAATPFSLSNSLTAYISGNNAGRTASTTRACYLFNRPLSASEVASLCINGVPFSDVGASQAALYTSDFTSTIDGWTTGGNRTLTANQTINGTAGWLQLNRVSGGSTTWNMPRASTFSAAQIGKRMRVQGTLWVPAATTGISYLAFDDFISVSTGVKTVVTDTEIAIDCEIIPTTTSLIIEATNSAGVAATAVSNGQIIYLKNIVVTPVGCTLQLDAENAQWDTGQIFDTSGNKNHGMLPAAGATVLPRKTRFEVRGTNTWTGTQELQYIGGVNQAILPANAFIETIAVKVTGTDVHDVFVGDGVDVDRYVVISGGGSGHGGVAMTVGSYTLPIANHATDGTNLKLTVDPDINCTMTIAWVITYYIME